MPNVSRRTFLRIGTLLGATALSGFAGSLVWSNRAVSRFENDMVIPLTPWLINTYLVQGSRPILVDSGFPHTEQAIESALTANGHRLADLSLMFITHGHLDHFGSAGTLRQNHAIPVGTHKFEVKRLLAGVGVPVETLSATGELLRALPSNNYAPAPVNVDVTFEEGDRLTDFGVDAHVVHTPGHTDGSLSIVAGGRAIIGDLMAGSLLYPDQPDYPFFIEDMEDVPRILDSLCRLLALGVEMFYPGHGLPFGREAAERWLSAQTGAR